MCDFPAHVLRAYSTSNEEYSPPRKYPGNVSGYLKSGTKCRPGGLVATLGVAPNGILGGGVVDISSRTVFSKMFLSRNHTIYST